MQTHLVFHLKQKTVNKCTYGIYDVRYQVWMISGKKEITLLNQITAYLSASCQEHIVYSYYFML